MIGMTSMRGSLDMMTPAACTPHCRFRPSSPWRFDDLAGRRVLGDHAAELDALGIPLGLGVVEIGERDTPCP
jgi:hypothetical protein